jgi:hypothetical protein
MSDEIRACVANQDFSRFFTWYRSGKVLFWMRGMDVAAHYQANTVAEFNALLATKNIPGLSPKGAGKRPERLTP